jgi:Fe-S cluster assembly protein SufD
MSVAPIKTKTEQAIASHFDGVAARLPGTGQVPERRRRALAAFGRMGLPHRRIEEWKYTDLRALMTEAFAPAAAAPGRLDERALAAALGPELARLDCVSLVFVNGVMASWSHGSLLADDPRIEVSPLRKALDAGEGLAATAIADSDVVTALNSAFAADGAVVRIAAGAQLDLPVHLVFLSDLEAPAAIAVRNEIRIGRDARATILESHIGIGGGARQTNAVTEITVGDGASVQHVKLLGEGENASHLGTWAITLGRASSYRACHLASSVRLARNQVFVTFAGEGGSFGFAGASLARGAEHLDTTMVIDHAVPRCVSRELFKAVLDGEAKAVFQGKVIVRPDAQKTDGKQMAKALMLSAAAEFDSKPELEIYADDVVCGHGSTVAEIDEDQLFYLRARGIPEAAAKALLVEAFVAETLDGIGNEAVRAGLMQRAQHWLAGNGR